MNIAFGTALILFLLFPGFAIRYSFLQGPYSRKVSRPSITEELFWSILPAIAIQFIGFEIVSLYYKISISDFYYLLIGADKSTINFALIANSIFEFLAYQITLIIISLLIGYSFRIVVLRNSWDKKFSFLKIKNDWYYLFSGRILDNPENVEFVQVDVLVNSDHGSVIYCGILNNYYLSPDGSIDKIYLLNVYRRSFSSDSTEETKNFLDKELDDRYYNMPGEYFVVFGHKIININVTYYSLIEDEAEANKMNI